MGTLRDRMKADLALAGYRPSTCAIYLQHAQRYAAHYWRSPAVLGEDEIRGYLLHQIEHRKVSVELYRQMRAALIFLYAVTLKRAAEIEHLPVRRRPKPLPVVLSGTEVQRVLDAVDEPKYRAALMAQYAAGLRISEACRLQPKDIDAKRMVIHVRDAKGGRDRYTVLAQRLLETLRDCWRTHRSADWLFPAPTKTGHISDQSMRNAFRAAAVAAGITKKVTPHVLRHCFATHLLESGVDITVVQSQLGHASLAATQIYAHISVEHVGRVKSPLDLLGTPAAQVLG